MRKLQVFYFLLGFIFFVSCGETTKNKEKSGVEEVVENQDSTSAESKVILFFGTSLTAGMGLDPNDAYPAVIQEKLDSIHLPYQVVNAGLSGETTASGRNRIGWVLKQAVDIFILELGANDGLRGIPLDETRKNLQAIIDTVSIKNPKTKIILAGMQIPPNLGQEYTSEFRNIFPDLANKNKLIIIPFLLEDVAGIPELNQQDGIHPTTKGQKILAENVWKLLEPLVKK